MDLGDIITKLFRCISRKGVMLLLTLSTINLAFAVSMLIVLTIKGEFVEDAGILLILGIIAVAYCLTVRLMLEDSGKMEPYYCEPYDSQSEKVYKLFDAVYRQKKDNRFLIKLVLTVIIIILAFVEIPAIKACYESNIPLILYGYFVIPFLIMVVLAISLILDEMVSKAKLEAMRAGEFTYAEVDCIEKYESFIRRTRYVREMTRHYFVILEDNKGNKGRFRVDENQYAMMGYASEIYLIKMNINKWLWKEPEVFVSMKNDF